MIEKENKKSRKGSLKAHWLVLLAVLVAALVLLVSFRKNDEPTRTEPHSTTDPTEAASELQGETSFLLEDGLQIKKIGSYIGAYMEDGSDDIVSGIEMIVVANNGEEVLQYAQITLNGSAGESVFKLSTLKPGEEVVVLEANRKAYSAETVYTEAAASNVVFFKEPVSLQEDKLEIQPLDGGFNITNISGEDIDGKITVYYKDASAGQYYGGITYRGTIEGGMKAGEVRQIMSEHFSASGSAVVFVTITEN